MIHPSPILTIPFVERSLARGWMTASAPMVMVCVPVRRAVSARVAVGERRVGGLGSVGARLVGRDMLWGGLVEGSWVG